MVLSHMPIYISCLNKYHYYTVFLMHIRVYSNVY